MGALYTIEINGGDSYHSYTSTVIWDKKGKVLTDFCATTGVRECRDATDDEIRPLDRVSVHDKSERFKSYKGKNLRIRLCTFEPETSCTKEITLSGFEIARVPDKNPGFFRYQIKYSEYKEGWFTKEVFFEVQNLTEWVYSEMWEEYWGKVSKDFVNRSEDLNKWPTDKTDNKKKLVCASESRIVLRETTGRFSRGIWF